MHAHLCWPQQPAQLVSCNGIVLQCGKLLMPSIQQTGTPYAVHVCIASTSVMRRGLPAGFVPSTITNHSVLTPAGSPDRMLLID